MNTWFIGCFVKKSIFPFHRSDYLCRESVDAAITHFFCRECCIYVLFCRECRDYALFDVEFYAEFLEEILRNTQNFGRKSAEKVGRWSLWFMRRTERYMMIFHNCSFLFTLLIKSNFQFWWQAARHLLRNQYFSNGRDSSQELRNVNAETSQLRLTCQYTTKLRS